MSTTQPNNDLSTTKTPGAGATMVYWVLIFMGVATFAPCIILPEWRHYQQLSMVEQSEQHRADQLRGRLEKDRQFLEAMRSDPAVIARLAQRDLRYKRLDEKTVPVDLGAAFDASESAAFVPQPVTPPSWFGRITQHLPSIDYDQIFCDKKTSSILMAMSVGLIAIAVGFVARRPA